jgi:ABC-2 type transport system ATP-binding protein
VPPVLSVLHLSKSYGDQPVLADVSLTLDAGDILAITGSNGSGKSTLLQCLLGHDTFDSGEVLLFDRPYNPESQQARAAVAAALGSDDAFLDLTTREHLEFVARAHGNGEPGSLIDQVLMDLGLDGVADHFPRALSQGQRRRLGLAGSLIRPRELLVLDEPEQNLDRRGRGWLAQRLLAEAADGVAVLLSSHDPDLVSTVADFVLELDWIDDTDADSGPGTLGPDIGPTGADRDGR